MCSEILHSVASFLEDGGVGAVTDIVDFLCGLLCWGAGLNADNFTQVRSPQQAFGCRADG